MRKIRNAIKANRGAQPLDRCVVEVAGRPVGILVREGKNYIFVSARRRFRDWDWTRFASIGQACRKLGAFAAASSAS